MIVRGFRGQVGTNIPAHEHPRKTQRRRNLTMSTKLLTAKDVAEVFHCSRGSLQRWIHETRKGQRRFPLPITCQRKGKLLWRETDIVRFIETGFSEAPPYDRTAEALRNMGIKTKKTKGGKRMKED